jgi:hypothetical protein
MKKKTTNNDTCKKQQHIAIHVKKQQQIAIHVKKQQQIAIHVKNNNKKSYV